MEFQRQVLLHQKDQILKQFQQATLKWTELKNARAQNIDNLRTAFDKNEKEACKLKLVADSSELDLLLQQINYQRSWIEVKLQNLERSNGRSLIGETDQQLVQEQALETSFLKEFPIIGKNFFRKLKKLLKKNKMTVQTHDEFGAKQVNGLPKPKFSSLRKAVREPQKIVTPNRSVKQMVAHVKMHPMVDRLRDKNGRFNEQQCSRQALEEILGHKTSSKTITKICEELQKEAKKIRKRRRKSVRREGNDIYIYFLLKMTSA